jgi:4-hydroxybenzoate polyprenyltransferase
MRSVIQERPPVVGVGLPLPPVLRAMRPKQFIKNGIVFTALVFSVRQAWRPAYPDTWFPLLLRATVACIAFCAVAAAEYLINDIRDREADRAHPRKRFRPIASGELSVPVAQTAAVLLFIGGFAAGMALGWRFALVLGGYAALMLAYSYVLKTLVLVDVLVIAVGFVLRAIAGALAIGVPISPWLYLCTLLGALFLAVNKRRHELVLLQGGAASHRPILEEYSTQLLDQLSAMVTAATLIAYSLYTFSAENLPKNHVMMVTIPFVIYGLFRYLFLVYQKDEGGSPDELVVRDRPLVACMALWICTAGLALALFR